MKLHLPLSLRSSLLACIALVGYTVGSAGAEDELFVPKADLGYTMFVGDSITHGFQSKGSYRWSLHKIFADNGISYNEVGVNENGHAAGNNSPFGTNVLYGSSIFRNKHSAVSGERAYEIAGTAPADPARLDGTNIKEWLNFESTGNYHLDAGITPNTYFLMIGTNDLLNAEGNHVSQNGIYEKVKQHLLGTQSGNNKWDGYGDMDVIINTMRKKSGANVDIVVLTVPTWDGARGEAGKQNLAADYDCVRQYNESLKAWGEWKGVKVVDINFGLVDVANTNEPWRAVHEFYPDKYHPRPQGELIIAGNIARALGYAGRTAGQIRKSADDFSTRLGDISLAARDSFSQSWGDEADLSHGFTVDFSIAGGIGNGYKDDNWDKTHHLSVSVGNGSLYHGSLIINEAYIQWGNDILFSMNTSELTDSLRIAYVYGNNAKNLPGGFYVWKDDQLIGEGLGNNGAEAVNGLTITNNTIDDITLEDVSMDGSSSYAPSTSNMENGNPLIASSVDSGSFPGKKDWAPEEDLLDTPLALSIGISANLNGKRGATINSGSVNNASMCGDDYQGDMYFTMTGEAYVYDYWGFYGRRSQGNATRTLTGNCYLRIVDIAAGMGPYGTFIGTMNNGAGGIDGDLYVEFSSGNVTIPSGLYGHVRTSIAGAFQSTLGITGTFRIVINDGCFDNIIGGSVKEISNIGAVEIFLNGGVLTGNVAAGGYVGSVGERSITITGDNIIFMPGTKLITAGAVPEEFNALFTDLASLSPTGTVSGAATVTLAEMTSEGTFAKWNGTLSGGQKTDDPRTLIFAGAKLNNVKATLCDFDVLTIMSSNSTEPESTASDVALSSIGGATEIQVGEYNKLTLLAGAAGEVEYGTTSGEDIAVDNDGLIVLQEGVTLRVATVRNAQSNGAWEVNGGKLIMGDQVVGTHDISMTDGSELEIGSVQSGEYKVSMSNSSMTVGDNAQGSYELTLEKGSVVNVGNGGSGEYKVRSADAGSEMHVGDDVTGSFDVEMGDGSRMELGENATVDDSTATMGDSGSVSIGAGSEGNWELKLGKAGKVAVGENAHGDYMVELGAGSEMSVGLNTTGEYHISLMGGGSLDTALSLISGTVVLDGSAAVNGSGAVFDLCGGLSDNISGLTLKDFAENSRVANLGRSAVTLIGENSITLTEGMTDPRKALMETTGRLTLGDGATLRINMQNVMAMLEEVGDADFYLTLGDVTSLGDAGEGKIVVDATALALNWTLSFRSTPDYRVAEGALHVHVPSAIDGHNVYLSNRLNDNDTWGRGDGNIYEEVDAYEAILINKHTTLDISEDVRPAAYEQDGLIMHNLIGAEGGDLRITDKKGLHTKLTISNAISSADMAMLEEMAGVKVENSLTFSGNITLDNLSLQIKHVDTATQGADKKPVGAPDSVTIMKGNLMLTGGGNVEMTSGVLRLEGSGNDFGTGDVLFAGTDSQLVVSGATAAVVVSGSVKLGAGQGLAGSREHIKLEDGATLEMSDGAHLGDGLVIGRNSAPVEGDVAGVISVQGDVSIARESRLSNVVLHLGERGSLTVGEAAQPRARAAVNTELDWTMAGLTGSGKLLTPEGRSDLYFVVSGGDHDFSGDLSNYVGTMTFESSSYTQSFTGVKTGSAWNVKNRSGAKVTFNLYADGNAMTMGKLELAQDSVTNLYFDFSAMGEDAGLHLNAFDAAQGAVVNVGQAGDGLVTLKGENGDEVKIAIITWADGAESEVAEGVSWNLLADQIKNAADVRFEQRENAIYLTTVIDDTNSYASFAQSQNAMAGAEILWSVDSFSMGGDMAALDVAVMNLLHGQDPMNPSNPDNVAEANRIMAAAAGASTAVLGQVVTGDVERQLRAIRNRTTSINHSDGREPVANVWLNAEGDYHKQNADGMLPGYKVNGWGGTVGASHSVGRGKEVGLALTAMYSDVESDGADRLKGDMDALYVSAFAQAVSGAWRHTVVCTVGTVKFDTNRTVNLGMSSYTTKGSTDGNAFGALYEVGYSISLREDGAVCLQPVANVALRHSSVDAFTESGSNAGLNVSQQKSTAVTFGLGARLQAAVDGNFWNRSSLFEARALAKIDCGDRDGQVDVAFYKSASKVGTVRSAEKGAVGVELGAGLSLPVGAMGGVFVDCSAELWQNYTNLNAAVGYKIDF